MSAVCQLSVLAVRGLFTGFCKSIGFEAGAAAADAATNFLGARFTDHSENLSNALDRATANAWRALETALAGDSWWDKIKTTLARKEDQSFREQVGAFLRITPLANLPEHPPEFRQQALRDLRDATKAGVLSKPKVDPQALAKAAGPFAKYADPQALLDAEWQSMEPFIVGIKDAGYPSLAHFLSLRPHGEMPMLVVAVRYFFRRELEDDPKLSAAMAFAKMEQLGSMQEAGFDAIRSAMLRHAAKLEEVLAGAFAILEQLNAKVSETHADVKDIKSAITQQGQTLDAMNLAVFRALSVSGTAPGAPVQREEDVRSAMLDTLLTTPHRDLMPLWPIHQELCGKDPRFYVRLAAWYHDKGEIRDHKEMFIITLCLSQFDGHRDVGLALLSQLPPYQLMRVVDFIHGRKITRRQKVKPKKAKNKKSWDKEPKKPKLPHKRIVTGDFGLFKNVPRSLKTEVARYLAEREAKPEWFDSTVLTARKALKRLYTVLHIKPGDRAQKVLFEEDPPADSRLAALKRIVHMTDPDQQAAELIKAKIPFRVALSVVSKMNNAVLRALITRMTPQEVINSMGMLQRYGAFEDAELKLLVDIKLEEAAKSKKVSALKAETALAAVDVGDELRAKLEKVSDEQIKARGRIKRSTALLIDKSGSMDIAIDVGKRIAAMISTVCEKELFVYAFDTMAYAIESKVRDYAGWTKAFAGINAQGETSVGVSLEMMLRRKQVVEQLIIVTDEEEYNPPFFVESYLKYRQMLGVSPGICFVKVPDSTTKLEDQCKRAGLSFTVFEFKGDYYSLPGLVALVEPPTKLDLLMEIMEWPLPGRKGSS
jgi:hypothetical protein